LIKLLPNLGQESAAESGLDACTCRPNSGSTAFVKKAQNGQQQLPSLLTVDDVD